MCVVAHYYYYKSVIREEELVSEKVAVPKYLGGDTGCDAQMSSPASWYSVSRKYPDVGKAMRDGLILTCYCVVELM